MYTKLTSSSSRLCGLMVVMLLISPARGLFGKPTFSNPSAGQSPSQTSATPQQDARQEIPLGPSVDVPSFWASGRPRQGLVLVDTFCPYHGLYMAQVARDAYGVATVNVLSEYMKGYFAKEQPEDWKHWFPMAIPNHVDSWKSRLPFDELVAVHCESDSGLTDSELFAISINATKHNGVLEARRDKYLMNELVGSAGLQVVKQKICCTMEEAQQYASQLLDKSAPPNAEDDSLQDKGVLGNFYHRMTSIPCCIVKPTRGVASEMVHLCTDLEAVRHAFEEIKGSTVFGSQKKHEAVLVQEFAIGQEYAIDIVSRDGEHKVAALWKYDKRAVNGSPFCYYATELIDAVDCAQASNIFDYAKNALDALRIQWGMTHTEIILTADGPRLVEVNCRQHNMDFAPICMACIGYNAIDMLLAAYFGGHPEESYPSYGKRLRLDWEALPVLPTCRAHGAMVHLVCSATGKLNRVQFLEEIESMNSVMDLEVYPEFLSLGNHISPTVDIRTDAGWVQLVNDDSTGFQNDYDRIVEMMPNMFEVTNHEDSG